MPTQEEEENKARPLAWYPSSVIWILAWFILTIVMIAQVEVFMVMNYDSDVYPTWYWVLYRFEMLFAQFHGPVTYSYLARLAVSAIQNASTAPRTWAELFWLANGQYEITSTSILRRLFARSSDPERRRVSTTFVLFVWISLLTEAMPTLLSRAYGSTTTDYKAWSEKSMTALTPAGVSEVHKLAQMSAGAGSWSTGLPITQSYSSLIYQTNGVNSWVSLSTSRSSSDAVVSAPLQPGEYGDAYAIRLIGDCVASEFTQAKRVPAITLPPIEQWCEAEMPSAISRDEFSTAQAGILGIGLTMRWCSTHNTNDIWWRLNSTKNTASAVVLLSVQNLTSTVEGLIKCNSTFTTGRVTLDGARHAYTNFSKAEETFCQSSAFCKDPFVHPLGAALEELTMNWGASEGALERQITLLRMWGLGPTYYLADNSIRWLLPSIDTLADRLWSGVLHMGAAVGVSALQDNQSQLVYQMEKRRGLGGHFIDSVLFVVAFICWIVALLYCSFRMFRPTFAAELNSYTVTRLLAGVPHITEDRLADELEENPMMYTRFEPVGDNCPESVIGIIQAGATTPLEKGRLYK